VARQASGEEIARAYRRAARASHPDSACPDSAGAGSAERFHAFSDAYELLRDPRRRAAYDRSHPPAPPRTADVRSASVRYAAPGSQHLVLGRSAQAAPFERQRSGIEEMARLVLSMLRADSGA
jgi:DnaJ-class molecular chaperone